MGPRGATVFATTAVRLAELVLLVRYEGDRKNFNFDKYMNLHVEQHNQHADLQVYGVAPLAENLKTLWFQDEIRDP